ncbi:MAG TPA: hypothetical protein VMG12_31720 [Polyangiaceae bacterium]|nr:hypothetical protein [Polyangiaceae bacterium]
MASQQDRGAAGARRERESVRELRRSVREAFPEPEHTALIDLYLNELSHLMDPAPRASAPGEAASDDQARHQATSQATDEDPVTLLCKLEDYLESILVGRFAKRTGA